LVIEVSGVHVYDPPVAVLVMTPTSFKSVERPFLRVMVTGAFESPPIQERVTGEPAAKEVAGNVVNWRFVD